MNTRFVPQLPRQVRQNLKSIGPKAKQVATMVMADILQPNVQTIDNHRQVSCNIGPYNIYYTNGIFKQTTDLDVDDRYEDLIKGEQHCKITPNTIMVMCNHICLRSKNVYTDKVLEKYRYMPPKPSLKITNNIGVWKTSYSKVMAEDHFQDSQQDFVNHQWPVGSPEAIYAKQYKMIKGFIFAKNEVLDKPVELATKAYEKMKNEPYNSQGDIDITAQGERMYVLKKQIEQDDGGIKRDAFDIILYNEEDRMAMSGTFTIVRDENGKPLKEAEDGRILKFGDPNYNDTQKLCFDISLETYHSDILTTQIKTSFTRVVSATQNGKYKHIMKMSTWDRTGENTDCSEITKDEAIPRYSQDWLDKRFSKVYYGTTKHDLKQAKHDLLSMRLNPADIALPPDSPDSIISKINADNLDSNDIRTSQPVAQEDQEANLSPDFLIASFAPDTPETPEEKAERIKQEKAFLSFLAQKEPESFVAFNDYFATIIDGMRSHLLNTPLQERLRIIDLNLSINALESSGKTAFEAFRNFKEQMAAQGAQWINSSPDPFIACLTPNIAETPDEKAERIAQEKEFLANLAQQKPESFVAFNEYMVNMKPEIRYAIFKAPINRRIGVMRNRLSKDANVALDAFNAFVGFRKLEAQEVEEAQDEQGTQVGQVAQETQEEFLANLAQQKPESYAAFRNYLANMEPEVRNSILDFSFDNRLNILRDLLRRNAPEAIEAFEAFENFMKSRVTQDPDEANIVDLED